MLFEACSRFQNFNSGNNVQKCKMIATIRKEICLKLNTELKMVRVID